MKIHEGEKYLLSGNMNMQKHTGNFNRIIGYFRNKLDSVPNDGLSETIPILAREIGLRQAYALNEFMA